MKKTLSTLALSLFALVGVAQAADITVENAAGFWCGRHTSCIRCAR